MPTHETHEELNGPHRRAPDGTASRSGAAARRFAPLRPRLLGARLGRQFPVIYELLESGALHLTALELLRHYLMPDNHAELLEAARFKKKAEIQELIARRFPKPDEPSTIRKVPERRAAEAEAPGQSEVTTTLQLESSPRTASSARTESEMAPLSAGRYRVRFTAGQELKAKLERALARRQR